MTPSNDAQGKWEQLETLLQSSQSQPSMALLARIRYARNESTVRPEDAFRTLSEVLASIKENVFAIEVKRDALSRQVRTWSQKSLERFEKAAERFYSEAHNSIMKDLESMVGYTTQYKEAGKAIIEATEKLFNVTMFKMEVKKFFSRRHDNPPIKATMDRHESQIDSLVIHMRNISRTESNHKSRALTLYPLTIEKLRLENKIKAFVNEGKQRYEQLAKQGFFTSKPEERAEIIRRFDASLVEPFTERKWIPEDQSTQKPASGLLGELFEKYLGKSSFESLQKTFESQEKEAFREFWGKRLRIEGINEAEFSVDAPIEIDDDIRAQISANVTMSATTVAAPILATTVLASGWHTLQWAMVHMFAPLAAIILPVTGFLVWRGKKSTLDSLSAVASQTISRMRQAQLDWARTVYVRNSALQADLLIKEFTKRALEARTGFRSFSTVNKFVSIIEDVCAAIYPRPNGNDLNLLDYARHFLSKGEPIAAAALAVPAFETIIDAWLARLEIPRPATIDTLRKSIELLASHPKMDKTIAFHLEKLRVVRNRWAHGMRDLAETNTTECTRKVQTYIEQLEHVAP